MASLTQAAKLLQVHHSTLRRWIVAGEGPRTLIKPNGQRATYRITDADLEKFIRHYSRGGKQF